MTDLLSLAVNRLDYGYTVTFQFSASCTLVTRCTLFNAHLARAHLFRVPNQLCTAYAVCACCLITETSLHTPETKRCAYSVVSHVGMNVRFFLKFEERTLLQSQQLLLFPKKLVSLFRFLLVAIIVAKTCLPLLVFSKLEVAFLSLRKENTFTTVQQRSYT